MRLYIMMRKMMAAVSFIRTLGFLVILLAVSTWLPLTALADDDAAANPVSMDPAITDDNWVSLNPEIPGPNNDVRAMVIRGSDLYVGGGFSFAGRVSASGIAKWDGSKWSALGSGINGVVYALAMDDAGNLYAGGTFTMAGAVAANNIAKWDGESWSALGGGTGGTVYALAVDAAGNLYAGGQFTTAGDITAYNIAKWDGSEWTTPGYGIGREDAKVYALAVDGAGNLYAGGHFYTAGGEAARCIARWDGNKWSALGSGIIGGEVNALVFDELGNLYAGGQFYVAGDIKARHIAKWDGTKWSSLGDGMSKRMDMLYYTRILTLAVDGLGNLYAGGRFLYAGGVVVNNIAKWDGANWNSLGEGFVSDYFKESVVRALAADGSGSLYAGGNLLFDVDIAGVSPRLHIAKWNGVGWSSLGAGSLLDLFKHLYPLNTVSALAVSGSDLYVGGAFTAFGGILTNCIARWDGSQWNALGTGMSGGREWVAPSVYTIVSDGLGNLYAGGYFIYAGGVRACNIAKWNGSEWSALGSGLRVDYMDRVYALAVDGKGNLYAGGRFTIAGGVAVKNVAKWDGARWSALGSGINGIVFALAEDGKGNLYAGGSFTSAGGVPVNRIAKWDGSEWNALGGGPGGPVYALAVDGKGNLYAGGRFTTAGDVPVNNIAKWDGSEWNALGSGIPFEGYDNKEVHALAGDGKGNLYAAGDFDKAGDVPVNNIAKWDGSEWSGLGSGVGPDYNNRVNALAVDGSSNLYVSGDFTVSGNILSPYVALCQIFPYVVTFRVNSGIPGAALTGEASQLIHYGENASSVTAIAPAGYVFLKWTLDGAVYSTANPLTVTNVTRSMALTAVFGINHHVTYTAGAGGAISGMSPQVVASGSSSAPVTAVALAGYEFRKWTLDGADYSTANPLTITHVTRDMTLTAVFSLVNHRLTYTAGAGGTISGVSPQIVANGASGTAVTAVPDSGYRFVQWSDGVTDNPRTDTQVTADVNVTAQYEPKKSGGGGGGCFVGALAR